jgi:hypothetical protein
MVPNEKSPLTPLAQEALDALSKELPDVGELTYEQAYATLKEEEDLERPAAEDIIERLYMKGHLYEVEGKLRLTDYGSNRKDGPVSEGKDIPSCQSNHFA